MSTPVYLGIDIGGTKIAAGLVSPSGRIIARIKAPTPKKATIRKVGSLIGEMTGELIAESNRARSDIRAAGIGVPGLVDAGTGIIISTPNMNLSGTDFARHISKKIQRPVYIGNDVKLGILGEQWLGAARGIPHVVGLFLGTGLGAGVIVNGRILLGTRGVAAEIGHMIIDPAGPKCTCGNRGCLEAFVGRWAIERDICASIRKGKRPRLDKLSGDCPKPIKSKTLARALKRKDPVVTPILREASRVLGTACVSLRHIFDPALIILGGGVIEACGDFIIPIVRKTLQKDAFFRRIKDCRIVKSKLGDDAIILGAAALARSHSHKKTRRG